MTLQINQIPTEDFVKQSYKTYGIGELKVVERDITEEELAKLFTQSFLKYVGNVPENELSVEFGLDQAKSLGKITEQYPVGTKLYIKPGLVFHMLK